VHVCSDLASPCSTTLHWQLTDTNGKSIREGSYPVDVPGGTCSVECPAISIADALAGIGRKNAILWIDLQSDGKIVSRKAVWFVRPKTLSLVDPQLKTSVAETSDGFDVTLTAAHPALWAWLDLKSDPDARYSDNFTHLMAGQHAVIHVVPSVKMNLAQFASQLGSRSLFDTYVIDPKAEDHQLAAQPDGSIIATADKAEIIGNSARLEAGTPPNIGGWSDAGDELDWSFTADHAGTYEVLIDLACPTGVGGSQIIVSTGASQVDGIVPVTGGNWTTYKVLDLGVLHIDKPGLTNLTLRATKMPHGNVMNLRSITLKPAVH
jgi:hypothetical protein